jgi:hypothetical protein
MVASDDDGYGAGDDVDNSVGVGGGALTDGRWGRWQWRNRGKWHLQVGEGAATMANGGGGEAPTQPWKGAKLGEEARRRALLGEEPGGSGSRGRKHGGGGMRCWEEGGGRSRGKSGAVCSGGVGGGCGTADGRRTHGGADV